MSSDAADLRALIRDIPDFPKPGILFRDLTPLLGDAEALIRSIRAIADPFRNDAVECVLGTEARGFIFGSLAAWDLGSEMTTTRFRDTSGNGLDGVLVNLPTRAMTGWNWTGETQSWRDAPEQYGAVHFHNDDLYDCGWAADFTLTVPETMRSGSTRERARMTSASSSMALRRPSVSTWASRY